MTRRRVFVVFVVWFAVGMWSPLVGGWSGAAVVVAGLMWLQARGLRRLYRWVSR